MSNRRRPRVDLPPAQRDEDSDVVVAVAGLMRRTGANEFQVRFDDEQQPIVWVCVAVYEGRGAEAGAGMTPGDAAWRLAEQLLDGGECKLCGQTTAVARYAGQLPPLPGVCQWRLLGTQIVSGCAAT